MSHAMELPVKDELCGDACLNSEYIVNNLGRQSCSGAR